MDTLTLLKAKNELVKTAQTTRAVVLPQVTLTGVSKKKKLSPEAMETLKELQQTPKDIYGGPVGSAAQSAALGGAVGTGLGFLGTGYSPGGIKATFDPKVKWKAEGAVPRSLRGAKAIRSLGIAGAGAGLASNIYYQAKKKHLKKRLEKALGIKPKGKKKQGADLLTMAAQTKAEQLLGR